MKSLIYSLLPVIGLQVLILVAALFVHVQSPGRSVVKLTVVPLALAGVLACPWFFVGLMGYAVSWPLPDAFTFIAYRPVVEKGQKTGIEIWLSHRNETRLLLAPYSKEMEEMLRDAAKGSKNGRKAQITRKGDGGGMSPEGDYELKFESPSDIPKDAAPPPPVEDEPITKRYSI